jgi:hypothetical protein
MAKTTLSNVVEELELQTEYLDLQSDNMTAFQEQLRADATQRALDDAETQGESGGVQKAAQNPAEIKRKAAHLKMRLVLRSVLRLVILRVQPSGLALLV